ncbi:unnamed protein product [Clavelina lepadiformis]|uniref:G-protein coupled receptors family 2 profile 2 domain-containing protein n=1 Tax=Clavelina lepadiformis TaxID=159417 RepID=A0ABP0GUV2_CLALP
MFRMLTICKTICVIVMLVFSSGLPTGSTQFVIGEPIPEPEDMASGAEIDHTGLDVVDVMNRGNFVVAAIEKSSNLLNLSRVTYHNVTYPMLGAKVDFIVDVTVVNLLNTLKEMNMSSLDSIQTGSRIPVSFKYSHLLKIAGENKTNIFVAVSQLFSTASPLFGNVKVDTHVDETNVGIHDCPPSVDVDYTYFITGNVSVITLHTFQAMNDLTHNGNWVNKMKSLDVYHGNVTFTTELSGQYVSVMKAVASQLGSIESWRWTCGVWDVRTRNWNTENCRLLSNDSLNGSMTCACSTSNGQQTSTFALLLGIGRRFNLSRSMLALCIAFEALSIISLLVALVILLTLRNSIRATTENYRSYTTTIHIHLCLALVLLHIVVLLRPVALLRSNSCKAVTILTHYFLLVSAAWMLVEGLTLYRLTCGDSVYKNVKRQQFTVLSLSSWLVPAAIVGFTAGFGIAFGNYMDKSGGHRLTMQLQSMLNPSVSELTDNEIPQYPQYSICWLNPVMTYAAAVPVTVLLIPNIVIAVLVCVRVARIKKLESTKLSAQRIHRESEPKRVVATVSSNASTLSTSVNRSKPLVASIRAFIILLPVLGVPWIATFVGVVPEAETTVTALHLLASSLQGLLVAITVCFLNRYVRRALRRRLRWKFQNFGSHRSHAMSSTT